MNNLDNLVHEYDNLILQRFSGLRKLLDPHDSENHVDFLARHHDIHEFISVCEGLCHNFGAQLSETPLKQVSNLIDRFLEHHSFHLRAAIIITLMLQILVKIELFWLLERVFSQLLNDIDNLLNGLDHDALGVI
jgi:hypothetical protein